MNILAFDTSSEILTITLSTKCGEIKRFDSQSGFKHSANLAAEVKNLIEGSGCSFSDLDMIACGRGPGSFTGIRVGLASLKAFASASGAKVLGLSSFRGALHDLPEDAPLVAPLLDARKGNIYTRIYRQQAPGEFISESGHILSDWRSFSGKLTEEVLFFGSGVESYRQDVESCPLARTQPGIKYEISSEILLEEARRRSEEASEDIDSISPLYLYADDCAVKK